MITAVITLGAIVGLIIGFNLFMKVVDNYDERQGLR